MRYRRALQNTYNFFLETKIGKILICKEERTVEKVTQKGAWREMMVDKMRDESRRKEQTAPWTPL